jgi:replicative DNA helicase
MNSLIPTSVATIQDLYQQKDSLLGLDTGFEDLNKMTGGLQAGTLTIIGGRPSMGKTVLMMNIVRKIAVELNHATAIVSYEDSKEFLSSRLLILGAQMDSNRLRCRTMRETEWEKLNAEAEKLQRAPITIDDRRLTFEELYEHCRNMKDSGLDLKLLVIDFMQIIPRSETDSYNRETTTAQHLKQLALDFSVAVVALSQLPRVIESRKSKRPMISDLSEGAFNADAADLVLFLYREEYYYPETIFRGEAELIIAKQRCGPTGTIELMYKSKTGFQNKSQLLNCDATWNDEVYSEPDIAEIWQKAERVLTTKLSAVNYESWIKPIRLLQIKNGEVTLRVQNRYSQKLIADNFIDDIRNAISKILRKNISLKIIVDER